MAGIKSEIEKIIDKINEKVDLTCGSIRNSIKEAMRPDLKLINNQHRSSQDNLLAMHQ